MPRRRTASSLAAVLVVIATAADAGADVIERGVVVSKEADEIYFDIPASTGIHAGARARIRHPIRLQHPVSGAWVRDELPVTSARVAMVGETLSMVRVDPATHAQIAVGDVIEVLVEKAEPAEQAPEPPPAELQLPTTDAETAAVLATWRTTAGTGLDVRIAAWEQYLGQHPESTYQEVIQRDLALLYELRRRQPSPLIQSEPRVPGIEHAPPRRAPRGEPLTLAFALRHPDSVLAGWLHYRRRGSDSYHRATLEPDGDGYLRGDIPGHSMADPGVEYFVEVATAEGRAGSAIGSPEQPLSVEVEGESTADALTDQRNRSRVSVAATYLDFSTFDDRREGDAYRDVYTLFESDFLFRLRGDLLYGIRVGMGVLNGRGGYADRAMAEPAGFNYGYSELEFRTGPTRAYLARLVAGLGEDGLGFGVEGRLRLGAEDESNLTFAISSLEEIGFLSEVRMQWAALRKLPIGLAVAVTDQPNNGDLGVRFTADVGIRALRWFSPTLRVSYQGRSVQHAGIGGGLGLVFDW